MTVIQFYVAASLLAGQSENELTSEWERQYTCAKQNYNQRHLELAEQCLQSALAAAEKSSTQDARLGTTLGTLGLVLLEQGRPKEAEQSIVGAIQAFRRCNMEACTLGIARELRNLAILYTQQNQLLDAERFLLEARRLYSDVGADAVSIADIHDSLAWLELHRHRPAAAESRFRWALQLVENAPQADRTRANLYSGLSAALHGRKRDKEAAEAARQALAVAEADTEANPLDIVNHACRLAAASSGVKDYALAETSLVRAQEILAKLPAVESGEMGQVLTEFGSLRSLQRRYNEAAEFQARALAILGRHLTADHPQMLALKENYASTLRKLKR